MRVLEEAGVTPAPYRTVTRRLRAFAEDSWRQQISAACAAHTGLGPASLVLELLGPIRDDGGRSP
jgi:hypothetical protein